MSDTKEFAKRINSELKEPKEFIIDDIVFVTTYDNTVKESVVTNVNIPTKPTIKGDERYKYISHSEIECYLFLFSEAYTESIKHRESAQHFLDKVVEMGGIDKWNKDKILRKEIKK